ncbi:MAG: hypothetical protein DWQ44_06440 [Bacteroidetes bacterium]|nr:MAG: hypothetical protein DWQ33_02910 [Bacteroidota bacterium]REK00935.1 MAG: hypothetical protein DWQ39_10205 [Bacteroidota bacterium]REK34538.1 MAG: hypothetical protein DWQ44_06440 [Bacteroidota bacterium]REK51796.1 MAG: hypothetical protein DWQ48_00035 [Bacteroidota bacterium]
MIRLNAAARDTLQIRPDNLLKKARLSDLVLIQDSKSLRDCLQTSWRGHKKNITFRVESSRGNV